jgi:hypothetical protein
MDDSSSEVDKSFAVFKAKVSLSLACANVLKNYGAKINLDKNFSRICLSRWRGREKRAPLMKNTSRAPPTHQKIDRLEAVSRMERESR